MMVDRDKNHLDLVNGIEYRLLLYYNFDMRKYLFSGSYTPKGLQGLIKEGGPSRIEAARKSLASAGGSLEAFYFALGEKDFYIIVNLPDDVTAAAVTLAGNLSETFTINSIVLLTPEEMDQALKKQIDFRAPGK